MAYKPRDESPGTYHVTCRGNNKRSIFDDDADRLSFLHRLARVARRHGWTIHAYCLMRNHYHLVIEIDDRGMSRGFCDLNTGHALTYNARHGRMNHLFGRRYWSGRLETQASFLAAVRYVLLNPVRAGLVDRAEGWKWSSYRATIGLALSDVVLATDDVLARFADERATALEQFMEYVAEPIAPTVQVSRARWQPP